jgi:hypothetical protein
MSKREFNLSLGTYSRLVFMVISSGPCGVEHSAGVKPLYQESQQYGKKKIGPRPKRLAGLSLPAPSWSSVAVGSRKMVRYGRLTRTCTARLPKTGEKAVADRGDVGWPFGMLREYALLGVDAIHQGRPPGQHQKERDRIPLLQVVPDVCQHVR